MTVPDELDESQQRIYEQLQRTVVPALRNAIDIIVGAGVPRDQIAVDADPEVSGCRWRWNVTRVDGATKTALGTISATAVRGERAGEVNISFSASLHVVSSPPVVP